MNDRTISQRQIDALAARADRLAELVELATSSSPNREVRLSGAKLGEIVGEWVAEIEHAYESDTEELSEMVSTFKSRLSAAEHRVASWPLPRAHPSKKAA